MGNPGEGGLAWYCWVNFDCLQTTWWVTLEREVWHGAVTTLPPKLSLTSMLAKAEVRASVLCFQHFIVFNISPVLVLPLPCYWDEWMALDISHLSSRLCVLTIWPQYGHSTGLGQWFHIPTQSLIYLHPDMFSVQHSIQYFYCHGLATTLLLRWLHGPGYHSLELKI